MSVEGSINGLIADIDQLNRLYLQLRNVPPEVQELVEILGEPRARLSIASRLLAKATLEESHESDVLSGKAFNGFRSRLLDFELMLDEEQFLHRSGPGLENKHSVPWDSCSHGDYLDFCFHFKEHIFQLNSDCQILMSILNTRTRLTPDAEDVDFHNSASPSLHSLRSFAITNPNSRASTPGTGPTKYRRSGRKASPRVKTEEELIFDKFVAHYSKLGPQGKRKRPSEVDETQLVGLEALSKQLPFPFPAGQEELADLERQIRRSTNYDNEDVPEWNLDDLRNALPQLGNVSPKSFSTTPSRSRGKQRASAPSISSLQADYSSSSSGSLRSIPREGSIFSISSRDRQYDDGHCKLWHHQVTGTLQFYQIARTEIRREAQQINGKMATGITIISTTPTGGEIKDSLWLSSSGMNSSPFLEHIEIVQAFQRRDNMANFIVRFAPNAKDHPQYSFASREDCWDFMQSITDKILCASLDVESIKSAATHGNASESGWETLQIWEDRQSSRRTVKFFRNKNEAARHRIVELDVGCLRQPEKERKTGKLITSLRDTNDLSTKDLKYLKIAFSNEDAEDGFMYECGFRKESIVSISTMNTEHSY